MEVFVQSTTSALYFYHGGRPILFLAYFNGVLSWLHSRRDDLFRKEATITKSNLHNNLYAIKMIYVWFYMNLVGVTINTSNDANNLCL